MDLQRPRVTEIHVRMDCNGCVQKVKKALHGINGIYDMYIDFPQQKLTIIGWADPERVVKAIKKTRKNAIICSHTEQPDPTADQTEPPPPPPEQGAPPEQDAPPPQPPAPEEVNPPPPEATPMEPPPGEPPKDQPPPPETPQPPQPEPEYHPAPEITPSPVAYDTNPGMLGQPVPGPRHVQQGYVTYHHQPDYGYRYGYNQGYDSQWNRYGAPGPSPSPMYETNRRFEPEPAPAQFNPSPGSNPMYETHRGFAPGTGPAPAPIHPSPSPNPMYETNRGPPIHQSPSPNPMYETNRGPVPAPGPAPIHPSHSPMYETNRGYAQGPSPAPIHPSPSPNPMYVTHSYNTHTPSTYVTEYEYVRSPPPIRQPYYSRNEHYNDEYQTSYGGSNNGNGNITSIFSDENPNACIIS